MLGSLPPLGGGAEHAVPHLPFEHLAGVFQILEHRLALQNTDVDVSRRGTGDDECNHVG